METLQMIQQLAPEYTMLALLALPWLAVMLMHAVSAGGNDALDDKWNSRAKAAVRWAGAGAASRPAAILSSKTSNAFGDFLRAAWDYASAFRAADHAPAQNRRMAFFLKAQDQVHLPQYALH